MVGLIITETTTERDSKMNETKKKSAEIGTGYIGRRQQCGRNKDNGPIDRPTDLPETGGRRGPVKLILCSIFFISLIFQLLLLPVPHRSTPVEEERIYTVSYTLHCMYELYEMEFVRAPSSSGQRGMLFSPVVLLVPVDFPPSLFSLKIPL